MPIARLWQLFCARHTFMVCRICTDSKGHKYAEQVQCARVYHINVVLRIRTSTQDKVRNKDYREKSMQIQRSVPQYLSLAAST